MNSKTNIENGQSASLRSGDLFGSSYEERMDARRANGHAWMMCSECGGKLYDFDGHEDSDRPCPFRRNGRCEPR